MLNPPPSLPPAHLAATSCSAPWLLGSTPSLSASRLNSMPLGVSTALAYPAGGQVDSPGWAAESGTLMVTAMAMCVVVGKCVWRVGPACFISPRRAACMFTLTTPVRRRLLRSCCCTTAQGARLPRALSPLLRRTLHEGGVLVHQPQPISVNHHRRVAPPHPAHHLQHSAGCAGKGWRACTFSCAECIACAAHASFTCTACHSLPSCGNIPKLPAPAPQPQALALPRKPSTLGTAGRTGEQLATHTHAHPGAPFPPLQRWPG